MRIRGSGSGFWGFGGGGGSRSDSFKKGRKVGQKVRGRIIKWLAEDRAWVEIEGHRLLAQLKSKHPVGAMLTFVIKQLVPEVILKEVFGASAVASGPLSLAQDFEASRTLFENAFRPLAAQLDAVRPTERQSAFTAMLATDTKLLSTFLDTTACTESINHHVEGTLRYQPWLIPGGRRQITLMRQNHSPSSDIHEVILDLELGDFGMLRAEFIHRPAHTSFRLKLQSMSRAEDLKLYINSRPTAWFQGELKFLGVTKLPSKSHGGIISEVLFSQ